MSTRSDLERNLQLIPWHELVSSTSPWISVFVLFTRGEFGLDGALVLAGAYYLVVVVFEVPSGWLSDRVGRVVTLRLVAVAWAAAFTCFLFGAGSFAIVFVGQACMAFGYASLSGTDVTFHYDTLEALGRQHEYPDRQSRVASLGLVAAATGALAGGILGLVELRLAFAASLLLAVAQLALATRLHEPPRRETTSSNRSQIVDCLRYLQTPALGWIFAYGIAMVVLEHVAFTLLQPWLTESLGESAADVGNTPLVSGATIGATALVGALFARHSARLARSLGVRTFLMGLAVLSATIVTTMAVTTSLVVLAIVAFRSAQGSAAPIVISNAVSSSVRPEHRATLLSLDSLGGRLAYGSLLVFLSSEATDAVSGSLRSLAIVSWTLVALIGAAAIVVSIRHGADRTI